MGSDINKLRARAIEKYGEQLSHGQNCSLPPCPKPSQAHKGWILLPWGKFSLRKSIRLLSHRLLLSLPSQSFFSAPHLSILLPRLKL